MQASTMGLSLEPVPKREAILAAALELMSERGFAATPVPAVAERAGVGAGTIYRYFRGKEELVNALYRQCKLGLLAVLVREVPENLSSRQEFRWMWCGLWEFASRRPRAFRFLETHHHAGYLDAESRAVSREVDAPIRDFVKRAQQVGEIRPGPPELLIALAFGAFVGMFRAAEHGDLELDEETLARSEDAAWRLLSI